MSHKFSSLLRTGIGPHRYTQTEAGFLCLAAEHAGVFVMRQYRRFREQCGKSPKPGNADAAFLLKAQALNHIMPYAATRNATEIFCLRPTLYRGTGIREVAPRGFAGYAQLLLRIQVLDYVLANPDAEILGDEAEKVEYFQRLGVPAECLPEKTTRVRGMRLISHRFPDRLPIVAGDIPTLVYVDQGRSAALTGFLGRHQALLRALQAARVVFVTRSAESADHARGVFDNAIRAAGSLDYIAIEAECRERRDLEAVPLTSMSVVQLNRLRELRSGEGGRFYEAWTAGGIDRIRSSERGGSAVQFEPFILQDNYSFVADENPLWATAAGATD